MKNTMQNTVTVTAANGATFFDEDLNWLHDSCDPISGRLTPDASKGLRDARRSFLLMFNPFVRKSPHRKVSRFTK